MQRRVLKAPELVGDRCSSGVCGTGRSDPIGKGSTDPVPVSSCTEMSQPPQLELRGLPCFQSRLLNLSYIEEYDATYAYMYFPAVSVENRTTRDAQVDSRSCFCSVRGGVVIRG